MADAAEALADPEEIVVDPIPPDVPLMKISPPGTPSGFIDGQPRRYDQRSDPNSAIQQSGPISRGPEKTTGIAFSGGGIRSAAFCSGALRKMLQDEVPMEYLSCVSGGGYTGAAFLDWKRRQKDRELYPTDKDWQEAFFEQMRENAGYMCNWQKPCCGIFNSIVLFFFLLFVVLILPCVLWLPYAFPIAVVVDVLFGGILRENSTCPPSVNVGTGTSFLILELYDNCDPPGRRLALFITTFSAWILFFILSRIKKLFILRNQFRFLSIISGMVFAFTFFPWLSHDFLWPLRTWIKVVVFLILLVLPFFFPIVRKVAGLFLFFYAYTIFVSWKVFKTELLGAVPYSDDVFYPVLMGCAIAIMLFPFIGSIHQSLFNIYYRYRLSKAFFFEKAARIRWQDFFPACGSKVNIITNVMKGKGFTPVIDADEEQPLQDRELTLHDLEDTSPTFISNITVNDWQFDSEAKSSHQLMAFSSEGVKVIGVDVKDPPDFKERFKPQYMRLSAAMAISGAAVSFDMGSYETGFDMVLDLLNLLGIGMGDEMVSDPCQCYGDAYKTTSGKIRQNVLPLLVEIICLLPLIAVPFVYWLGHSEDWVQYLVLVHIVVVVVLTGLAMFKTGSTEPGLWQRFIRIFKKSEPMVKTGSTEPGLWQRFISWWIRHHFFVRFIRGFLSVNNVGTHPPPVLRLSDGGHFENLALLPLLDKRLKKIVIFDGSCNPGDDKYAESLLTALKLAREKLHCSFEGMDGRDINEDIRVNFLKLKSKQRPRSFRFKVHYYDEKVNKKGDDKDDKEGDDENDTEGEENDVTDVKVGEGEILFVAPRHPSESIPLQKEVKEQRTSQEHLQVVTEQPNKQKEVKKQPKPWKDFDVALGKREWGEGPELTKREADRLTFCCCHCCHYYGSSHCISDLLLGRFPHHITANQFFTPDTFSAYHREGYAACVEADVADFFKSQSSKDAETQTAF